MKAIFKREFKSYFTSSIGFAVMAIFCFFSALFFSDTFSLGNPDLSEVFSMMFLFVLVIIPILTMRLFSEDKRQKTDQLLFTSPVRLTSIVLGKFFAAVAMLSITISIMVVYQIVISFYITPDWMVFLGNFIGLFMFGTALVAIGIFISSLTESQGVAALVTFAVEVILVMMDVAADKYLKTATGFFNWLYQAVNWISVYQRYESFTGGTLDYANVVFFASIAFVFLFITVMMIDRKRYV